MLQIENESSSIQGIEAQAEEHSGSVVECLIGDLGVVGSSFTGGPALCPLASHFIICLFLVQSRKTCHGMTEKC